MKDTTRYDSVHRGCQAPVLAVLLVLITGRLTWLTFTVQPFNWHFLLVYIPISFAFYILRRTP